MIRTVESFQLSALQNSEFNRVICCIDMQLRSNNDGANGAHGWAQRRRVHLDV